MAATSFTPISLYYSSTASNVPTAGNLVAGELAINTADGVLYYKDSSGVVQSIASKAGNSGSFTNLAYTGTFTGGTGIVNLGSGQFYKDASGNVGIGTASPNVKLDVIGDISAGDGGNTKGIRLGSNGFQAALLYNGNGNLDISPRSGFATVFKASEAGSEYMRIDSSGNVLVGTTSRTSNEKMTVVSTGNAESLALTSNGTYATLLISSNLASGSRNLTQFRVLSTDVGSISSNGTITIYGTTSDYRLKTEIAPVIDAGERLDALEPIEYDFKAGGRTRGFLAHQFAEVYPNSVSGKKDAVDEDGKPVYQGMQASTSEVMADLIAEIQSLRKRVTTLEAQLTVK